MINAFESHLYRRKIPYLQLVGEREKTSKQTTNVEKVRVNAKISILPLPSANDLIGGRMNGQRPVQIPALLVLEVG